MGSISDYLENKLLDHVFNGVTYTPPTTVYLGLSTADPLDDGSGLAEPAGGGYARVAITFNAAASRKITQSADAAFAQATASWGTITHYALFDAATGGNMMAHGAFGATKQIVAGDQPTVAAGQIYVEIATGGSSDYLANALLDFAFRNIAFASPSTYVALTTAIIGDSDTGSTITEPSGGAYARVQVNVNGGAAPAWNLASSGVITNADSISFAQATADWGTVVAACVVDASTGGNVLVYDNDNVTDQAVATGDTASFPAGNFSITLS